MEIKKYLTGTAITAVTGLALLAGGCANSPDVRSHNDESLTRDESLVIGTVEGLSGALKAYQDGNLSEYLDKKFPEERSSD